MLSDNDVQVGDLITFLSHTRSGSRKAARRVTKVYGPDQSVCVTKYHGWKNFRVRRDEIILVEQGEET